MNQNAILCDPDILAGTPCFAGTRVPVRILFEYLESNESLEGFLDDFPSVTREQAPWVLEKSKPALLAA